MAFLDNRGLYINARQYADWTKFNFKPSHPNIDISFTLFNHTVYTTIPIPSLMQYGSQNLFEIHSLDHSSLSRLVFEATQLTIKGPQAQIKKIFPGGGGSNLK